MGTELHRMIRDGAPETWTPLMRLVAGAIADDAEDPRQREKRLQRGQRNPGDDDGWPWSVVPVRGKHRNGRWHDGLTERTGMSLRAIRRVLAELSAADYEMREQIDTDKRGRPVFAYPGRATRFRVPPLKPRDPPPDPATTATGRRPDSATIRRPDSATTTAPGRRPDSATTTATGRRPDSASTAKEGMVAEFGSEGGQIWSSRRPNSATQSPQGLPMSNPAPHPQVLNSSLERVRDGQGDDDSETRSAPKPGSQRGSCGVCGGTRYRVGDDGLLRFTVPATIGARAPGSRPPGPRTPRRAPTPRRAAMTSSSPRSDDASADHDDMRAAAALLATTACGDRRLQAVVLAAPTSTLTGSRASPASWPSGSAYVLRWTGTSPRRIAREVITESVRIEAEERAA